MKSIIKLPDCCEDCYFHIKETESILSKTKQSNCRYKDERRCSLHDRYFHIDELFDEGFHHQLRPSWCDILSIKIKNGWKEAL